MARLINGGEFGEMRGSLGNNVFTKTAAGAIMRRRAIPVNRNSAGQVAARGQFATVNQRWTDLDSVLKDAWENYAQNGFAPAKYSHTVAVGSSHRGRQAFVSLNSILAAAIANQADMTNTDFLIGSTTVVPTAGTVTDGDNPPPSGTAKPDGILGAQVTFPSDVGTFDVGGQDAEITFVNTTAFDVANAGGIMVYSSERLPYVGARPRSPKLIMLGAILPIASTTPAPPTGTGNTSVLTMRSQYDPMKYVQPIAVGETRMFTIYGFDEYGAVSKLGSQYFLAT